MASAIEGFVDYPTWNLDDLYKDVNDPKINEDFTNIENQINDFVKKYTNAELKGTTLLNAIKAYQQISEALGKISTFAGHYLGNAPLFYAHQHLYLPFW